jgi:hypothetical protein
MNYEIGSGAAAECGVPPVRIKSPIEANLGIDDAEKMRAVR